MCQRIRKLIGLLLVAMLVMGSGSSLLAASPGGMGGRVITRGTLPDQAKAAATLHIGVLKLSDESLTVQDNVFYPRHLSVQR